VPEVRRPKLSDRRPYHHKPFIHLGYHPPLARRISEGGPPSATMVVMNDEWMHAKAPACDSSTTKHAMMVLKAPAP